MNTKSRGEVRKTATDKGATQSLHDSDRQYLNGTAIIHIETNRTKVGTKLCFGEKAAKDAIKGL